jgi:hypothetical protein
LQRGSCDENFLHRNVYKTLAHCRCALQGGVDVIVESRLTPTA